MQDAVNTILDAVGRTPVVKLQRIGADLEAEIYVKCEYLQPSGSAKDRMAARLVTAAEEAGRLAPGGTLVEATSGNTGSALAMVAAVRGYRCIFVVPDKTSTERIGALRAFGARVIVAPTAVEPDDPRSAIGVAKATAEATPNSFYVDQHSSADNPAGHASLGEEIWEQCGDSLDAVVTGLGTGGTIAGIGQALRKHSKDIALVGVDPAGSVYHPFKETGRVTAPSAYMLEGIGADFFAKTANLDALESVVQVSDGAAFRMTRDLVRLEGLYAGGSSGAAVWAALEWARTKGGPLRVLAILPDGASGYLSKIFNDEWMRGHGFLGDDEGLGTIRDLLAHKSGEGVITARYDDRVRDVIKRMKAHGISQLPVMQGDVLLGAVAEVDLLRYLVSGESSLDGAVEPLVESDFATVAPTTPIESVQRKLSDARMAIVIDEGRIVGIVTKIDLIDYLARVAS